MSNSEAIETLQANYPDSCYELLRDAVDTAICALSAQPKDNEMNERYYEVYLTSGNIARVKADVMYSGCGSYTLEKDGKVVARFSCVTVEGWVKEDGETN